MTEQAQPPAPPQYSPDGQWWWDGHHWWPADERTKAMGAYTTAAPTSADFERVPTPVSKPSLLKGDITGPLQLVLVAGAVIFLIWMIHGLASAG